MLLIEEHMLKGVSFFNKIRCILLADIKYTSYLPFKQLLKYLD